MPFPKKQSSGREDSDRFPLSPHECEAIRRLSLTVREHREPRSLLEAIPDQLREFIDFDAIVIAQSNTHTNSVIFADYAEGKTEEIPRSVDSEDTFTQWVLDRRQPLLIDDADTDNRFGPSISRMRHFQMKSACVLPLSTAHRNIGSFSLACKRTGAYQPDQMPFLAFIADQVAMALDDAMHSAELKSTQGDLERRNDHLRLLLDLTYAFRANIELRELLRSVSANLRSAMYCDEASIALSDAGTGKLHWYAIQAESVDASSLEGKLVPGDVQAIYDAAEPTIVCSGKDGVPPTSTRMSAECHIRLSHGSKALGLMSVARERHEPFTEENVEFLGAVAQQVAIALENSLAYEEIRLLRDQLAVEKVYLEDEIRSETNFDEIIGQSACLREVLRQVEIVAPTGSTVLICGDTGTGKELVARAIHNLSPRAKAPFVKLNCAAIPTGLLESELFGHERGAFTGAIAQRIGRFEVANHGTVFLDEIGEIPLELQPKLLRVLQEREFERLGSSRTISTDARLIAATNRDLEEFVEQGKFRADLFYRLNVFPLRVPRLNERKEDIPMLVRHFVRNLCNRMNKDVHTIPAESMHALVNYTWPGNVRELQNVLERAVILSPGPVLNVRLSDLVSTRGLKAAGGLETLETIERKHILEVLKHTRWIIAGPHGAANLLGLKRSTLQAKMQRLGIRRPSKEA